jgi:hypothetical protein
MTDPRGDWWQDSWIASGEVTAHLTEASDISIMEFGKTWQNLFRVLEVIDTSTSFVELVRRIYAVTV